MRLLYLDDSGTVGNAQTPHCIFAGFSIFETQTHWTERDIDAIATKYSLPPDIEFHASHIKNGKKAWRKVDQNIRHAVLSDLCNVIKNNNDIRLFATINNIAKCQQQGLNINTSLFTQIASRFDMSLWRIYRDTKKRERGIIIFDKSKSEYIIQNMSHEFKRTGHQWGMLRNLAEVPLFLDSKASRLIQLADIVAYAVHLKYNRQNSTYFSIIENCFDAEKDTVHGLHEYL